MPLTLPPVTRTFKGAVELAHFLKGKFPTLRASYQGNVTPGFLEAVKQFKPESQVYLEELKTLSNVCFLVRKDNVSSIFYSKSFNFCYRRFGICKELCHILTDDASVMPNDALTDIAMAHAAQTRFQRRDETLFTSNLKAEEFCIFLAFEMIVPFQQRGDIMRRIQLTESPHDIANNFKVPEALIRFYVQSPYHIHWAKVIEGLPAF